MNAAEVLFGKDLDVRWLPGWYATRLHAVPVANAQPTREPRKSLCGAVVYGVPLTDWAEKLCKKGQPFCKHCEAKIRKAEQNKTTKALSPSAQAVLNPLPGAPHLQLLNRAVAAAVLHAAADHAIQILAEMSDPSSDWGDGWKQGGIDMAQGLLAIAAELEGYSND